MLLLMQVINNNINIIQQTIITNVVNNINTININNVQNNYFNYNNVKLYGGPGFALTVNTITINIFQQALVSLYSCPHASYDQVWHKFT